MNVKTKKRKYHDTKELFGKEYFKSYYIKPKVHLSLSPSSNRLISDNKKNEIKFTKNSSNNLSSKNKESQIIKISKNKSNTNYFKLVKSDKRNTKILIKSIINKSNINLRKTNENAAYLNFMSITNRKNICKKKNSENYINKSNTNYNDYSSNININFVTKKHTDMNLKKIKNNKSQNINKLFLYDSIFKNEKENQINLKNVKNKDNTFLENNKSKNIFNLKQLNKCSGFCRNNKINNNKDKAINNKNYLKTIETNMLIKKVKINNTLNKSNINQNKSCDSLHKTKITTTKNKKNSCIIKKKVKYILLNSKKQSSSNNSLPLFSQIVSKNSNYDYESLGNIERNNKKNDKSIKQNRKSNIANKYCGKNKSIDVNSKSFKNKFLPILIEQRKKIREEELKQHMKEIEMNSNLRNQKYIKLFLEINQSLSDIKQLIEQIEKEDLLKDFTSKINDDMSYESILSNDNSFSIEQKFKSLLNNRLFNNMNEKNNIGENSTSIIYNDCSFAEDKNDITLKSIDIKKNTFLENNPSKNEINGNIDICLIF